MLTLELMDYSLKPTGLPSIASQSTCLLTCLTASLDPVFHRPITLLVTLSSLLLSLQICPFSSSCFRFQVFCQPSPQAVTCASDGAPVQVSHIPRMCVLLCLPRLFRNGHSPVFMQKRFREVAKFP